MLSRYDLLANIVHDGKAGEGSYRCHIHRKVHFPAVLCHVFQHIVCDRACYLSKRQYICLCHAAVHNDLQMEGLCVAYLQVEENWYEVQDLRVTDVLPQMVALSESYLQLWSLRTEESTRKAG